MLSLSDKVRVLYYWMTEKSRISRQVSQTLRFLIRFSIDNWLRLDKVRSERFLICWCKTVKKKRTLRQLIIDIGEWKVKESERGQIAKITRVQISQFAQLLQFLLESKLDMLVNGTKQVLFDLLFLIFILSFTTRPYELIWCLNS